MSVSARTTNAANEVRLPVPQAYLRHVRRRHLRGVLLVLAIVVPSLLLLEYCLRGHVTEAVRHLPWFLVIMALAQPLQFYSRGSWVYVVNDDGVFLRDDYSPIDRKGYPLLQWKQDSLIEITPGVWQGWPALSLSYRRMGHMGQKTMTLPYRPEDEDVVAQTLMPCLTARLRFQD